VEQQHPGSVFLKPFAELVEQQHPGSVFLKPLDMDAIEQCVRGLMPITT
jgi:hypothetical protein